MRNSRLVGGFNPSEKNEFVSWDYYSQYMARHKSQLKVMFQTTNQQVQMHQSAARRSILFNSLDSNDPSVWLTTTAHLACRQSSASLHLFYSFVASKSLQSPGFRINS